MDAWFQNVEKAFTKSFRTTRANVEHSSNRDMQTIVSMMTSTLNTILQSENQHMTYQSNATLLREELDRVVQNHYAEETELMNEAETFRRKLEAIQERINLLTRQVQDDAGLLPVEDDATPPP